MSNDGTSSSIESETGSGNAAITGHGIIAWGEACTPAFMAANTDAPDFDTFAKAGGFDISSQDSVDRILPSELDTYVKIHTCFPSWSEMKTRAFADWERRKAMQSL